MGIEQEIEKDKGKGETTAVLSITLYVSISFFNIFLLNLIMFQE